MGHKKQDPKHIRLADYSAYIETLKHIYLAGDLPRRPPHVFVEDSRLEIVLCHYRAGDNGEYHWHRNVTEYDMVIQGRIGYADAVGGDTNWYEPGDLCVIEPGRCVRRLVREDSKSITIKVPSLADDKVSCDACQCECGLRK